MKEYWKAGNMLNPLPAVMVSVKGKDGNKCTHWEGYNKIRITDTKEILKAINNLHREVKVCENELKKLSFTGDFE